MVFCFVFFSSFVLKGLRLEKDSTFRKARNPSTEMDLTWDPYLIMNLHFFHSLYSTLSKFCQFASKFFLTYVPSCLSCCHYLQSSSHVSPGFLKYSPNKSPCFQFLSHIGYPPHTVTESIFLKHRLYIPSPFKVHQRPPNCNHKKI